MIGVSRGLRSCSFRRTNASSRTPTTTTTSPQLLPYCCPWLRRTSIAASSSSSWRRSVVTVGIMRETYDTWERRAPLSPTHVQQLLQGNNNAAANTCGTERENVKVIVQPCPRRVFTGRDYEQAGAVVQEDLTDAQLVLGVKRPSDPNTLLPDKTYVFFSHTIKGQRENMNLLRTCLDRNIQLLDYERMMKVSSEKQQPPKRLVAFGRFAGLAGALDSFHALGRRLLYEEGRSTPFLTCAPAILTDSLAAAQDRIRQVGEELSTGADQEKPSEPLVFCVTGKRGAVHEGVMEMLRLLPHEIVAVDQLPGLFDKDASNGGDTSKVYICPVGTEDVFQRCDDDNASTFDRGDFLENPTNYRSTFSKKVVPYVQVLINAAYWDQRFPRLLTKAQMRRLYEDGQRRLLLVSDISCDVHGSIEFLERTTTIDRPFFLYDPISEEEVAEGIVNPSGGKGGITVLGVDILPSELPRESSEFFGSTVVDVVQKLVKTMEISNSVDVSKLPRGLATSCITTADGRLEPSYQYLDVLMKNAEMEHAKEATAVPEHQMLLSLKGHLFDSGLINQVMDVIERHECGVTFRDCYFPTHAYNQDAVSTVVLCVNSENEQDLDTVESLARDLANVMVKANATIHRLETTEGVDSVSSSAVGTAQVQDLKKEQRVLILGAGFVAKSAVDLLGRNTPNTKIKVASHLEDEARSVASAAKKATPIVLDVTKDVHRLSDLIDEADVVLSLLPAPMHPVIARECILQGTHLITCSYESEEMRSMRSAVEDAGVIFLNEVGLDPGLDHMSAMKILDDIKARGGVVTGFSSVCGGLPAPDFANNPLQYKFSWSPKGVLRASTQDARYRLDDHFIHVPGENLLASSRSFDVKAWPDLSLEVLPNRDSLSYEKVYGLDSPQTMFRGTLRYRGFSALMSVFQRMGLLDPTHHVLGNTWGEALTHLAQERGFQDLDEFVFAAADKNFGNASKALEALRWLDMLGARVPTAPNLVDSFCDVLEKELRFEENEYDITAMHHTIDAVFDDGTEERHLSSLRVFGDDQFSAMSKTVGFTAAASTELILNGSLVDEHDGKKGNLLLPTSRKIYEPVLKSMEKEGIRFEESIDRHYPYERQQG